MIRRTVVHAFEGDNYHDLCVFLGERLYEARKPKVRLWGPEARDQFRFYEEWPGLPDMVVTLTEGRTQRTYVIEFENNASTKNITLKRRQFHRYGIKDVIVIPIKKFESQENWQELERQIEEWLP